MDKFKDTLYRIHLGVVDFNQMSKNYNLNDIPSIPLEFFLEGKLKHLKKMYRKGINYIGNLEKGDEITVGVVGTRKMTEYGRRVCSWIGEEFAAAGVCVVSGLMYGVDLAIHQAVLQSGGRTIAVLGYGINHIHKVPYAQKVYRRIIENNKGALVSQFIDEQEPQVWTFAKRNHLIAALSDVIIVVESDVKSGSHITVSHALDLGKQVYAVPGSIYSKSSAGTNLLIRAGAEVFISPAQVLESLGIKPKSPFEKRLRKHPLDDLSRKLLDFIESKSYVHQPVSSDEILFSTSYPQNEVYKAIVALEINGLIEKDLAGRYTIRP